MARGRRFDRVVALDEFDLEMAAEIREHWRLPGMGVTTTAFYRDKLAMRTGARERGFLVPEFCRVVNYDELRAYMAAVPAPWLLKPRTSASALGIRKIHDPEQLWRTLDELGDRQSHFVLEHFVPGEIFHVDSIVSEGKVVFSTVHQYGRPPMQVMHEGGVFTTRTVDRAGQDWKELTAFNAALAPAFGTARGVTHAEYIKAHGDGKLYFLEIAARVGGAFISDLVEASTSVNLWREWARIEVASLRGQPYVLPRRARRLCGQRAVPFAYGRAGYQRLRRAGDRAPHEEAPPCGADRALERAGAGAGTAGGLQRPVCEDVSGHDAGAGEADGLGGLDAFASHNSGPSLRPSEKRGPASCHSDHPR